MYLFIDTNIFLSFYHLTKDDLEELRKLSLLIKKGGVMLILTDQVEMEFWRNRENKIADSIRRLKEQKLNLEFPQLCKGYKEYSALQKLQDEYKKSHSELLTKIMVDIENNTLQADEIIIDLFEKADCVESIEKYISDAKYRINIGNPPGKNGSLGDAINWGILLDKIPLNEKLFLVSDDKDFYSKVNVNKPKEFLVREWKEIVNSTVFFYRRLSPFFKEHFPDIKFLSDLEKDILVGRLIQSSNFTETHFVISQLKQYDDFGAVQVNSILEAYLANGQIRLIAEDDDVKSFLENLIKTHAEKIDEGLLEFFKKMLSLVPEDYDSEKNY